MRERGGLHDGLFACRDKRTGLYLGSLSDVAFFYNHKTAYDICLLLQFKCFFFQAEDGIRDLTVTGVQTCALPIWPLALVTLLGTGTCCAQAPGVLTTTIPPQPLAEALAAYAHQTGLQLVYESELARSEERRVGKECRSRWSPYH